MVISSDREFLFVLFLGLFFGCLTTTPLLAQDSTFTVTVEQKNSNHPWSDEGNPNAYAIDGKQDPDLVLERGKTYYFVMDDVGPTHPFYMSLSDEGYGQKEYEQGVTNNYVAGNDTLIFEPTSETPDSLYYQCQNHLYMGNIIQITGDDTKVADKRSLPGKLQLKGAYPNPFNPATQVRFSLRERAAVQVEVFNDLGQKVLQLPAKSFPAGHNQSFRVKANGLPSGVYHYRLTANTTNSRSVQWGMFTLLK